MRHAVVFSLPVEMKTVKEEEERNGIKECTGKQEYGEEKFICISVEEMESYYNYTHCCQRLHGRFCRGVYVRLPVVCDRQEPLA